MMVSDQSNGHVKGRAVPPLPEHTFADSGITVRFHRIPPMTQQRLVEAIQRLPEVRGVTKATPPVVHTELGPETNEADPGYLAQKQAWENACALELNERLFKRACLSVVCDIDYERLAEARRLDNLIGVEWPHDAGLDQEENDRLCYVQHVCCATPDDMKEFYQAITTRSMPTEAAIDRAVATFQG